VAGKTKADLHKEAVKAGAVADETQPDDFTAEQLEALISGNFVASERVSSRKPLVAPDGHVVLSQADIDARDQ
jgi:hypothetical protein